MANPGEHVSVVARIGGARHPLAASQLGDCLLRIATQLRHDANGLGLELPGAAVLSRARLAGLRSGRVRMDGRGNTVWATHPLIAMLEPTYMAMACCPCDCGVLAGGGRIRAGAWRSGGGLRLSLHAARCGPALFRNFTVAVPVIHQLSVSLRDLSKFFVNGLKLFDDSTLCPCGFPIGWRPRGSGSGYDSATTLSRSITMAFVNETIPEADLHRIDFAGVIHPLHSCPIDTPSQWTIDRERDIALIDLGGGSGQNSMYPRFFLIYWQGKFTDVHLTSTFTGNFPTWDMEVTWMLRFFRQLDGVSEEIFMDTLKEALTCYGYINSSYRDRIKDVKFHFDNNTIIRG